MNKIKERPRRRLGVEPTTLPPGSTVRYNHRATDKAKYFNVFYFLNPFGFVIKPIKKQQQQHNTVNQLSKQLKFNIAQPSTINMSIPLIATAPITFCYPIWEWMDIDGTWHSWVRFYVPFQANARLLLPNQDEAYLIQPFSIGQDEQYILGAYSANHHFILLRNRRQFQD